MKLLAVSLFAVISTVACDHSEGWSTTGSGCGDAGATDACSPAALLPCGADAGGCACLDADNVAHCAASEVPWCCYQSAGADGGLGDAAPPHEPCEAPADCTPQEAFPGESRVVGGHCCPNYCN